MATIIAKANQSMMDLVIQGTGSLEGAVQFCVDNNVAITDTPTAGTAYLVSSTALTMTGAAGAAVLAYLAANNIVVGTLGSPNWATWNVVNKPFGAVFSNGNLTANVANGYGQFVCNVGMGVEQKVCELRIDYLDPVYIASASPQVGLVYGAFSQAAGFGGDIYGYVALSYPYGNLIETEHNGTYHTINTGMQWTVGDVLTLLYDGIAKTLTIWKNGTALTTVAFTILNDSEMPYYFAAGDRSGRTVTITANFGATAWTYAPPSGFSGLVNNF